jgi:hypothetical protein
LDWTILPETHKGAVIMAAPSSFDDDDDDPPRELTPEEQQLHAENMVKLRRLLRAYTIAKIGIVALIIVVIIKFFGR